MPETSGSNITQRAIAEGLEACLGKPFSVLDHGFVRVVDYMGNDAAIVQAARVSYGLGTKSVSEDAGLINYLMMNAHTSPFEMCEIKLHVKLPIFVARQWIRHRMANVNEVSGRYSVLPTEHYLPEAAQLCYQSARNKQGKSTSLSPEQQEQVQEMLRTDAVQIFAHYAEMLALPNAENASENGLTRELARINLPLSTYTEWYWKIDLHNLLHFLSLRLTPHAQYEIRTYTEVLLDIVKRWVPLTYAAFVEHRLEGARLSKTAIEVIRRIIAGAPTTQEESGLNKREWENLRRAFLDV
ncbi:MAG: FAD-dependent thymidylate synthase [Holosporales bacterium]|jgi:thymidylate synthase (FAD)|nr:FAD-dependent thymidylate synthase [Holosporales bacterium]